jgi:hypothetical protein
MNEIASHAIAFLLGTATGASGKYFADKYTDRRRRGESEAASKREFSNVFALMPDLIREMQHDLAQPDHATWREFFVIPKGTQVWATPNSFYYEDDGRNNYLGKAKILASRGYVVDVTPGSAPKFQMTEGFVAWLKTIPSG